MKIAQRSTIFVGLAAAVVVVGILLFAFFGLKLGIDFTGGSLLEIRFIQERPEAKIISDKIQSLGVETVQVKTAGDTGVIVKMDDINEEKHQEILSIFNDSFGEVVEERFETIGPVVGKELKSKAYLAISLVLICIVLYLAYAFRKVSSHISPWKFGVTAIAALIHDIAVIVGVFVLLGIFMGVEVDALFVTALLTVLGFSVHDTIVVFDRVRFNLIKSEGSKNITEVVNESILQTLVRSINTSSTTLLVLAALYLFGGASIQWFVLALIIGVLAGTYSSIFVASPLLVFWERYSRK
ncbi:protein translocase subunit SecF [Patescibacteria group bacterium]|nr:protein translocase subunit SecF [Patescibacteria group bacterium]